MQKITIIVFGKSLKLIETWIKRHETLIAIPSIDVVAAYWRHDEISTLHSKVKYFQGCENSFERIRQVIHQVGSEYVLLCASDDECKIPNLNFNKDLVIFNTYFKSKERDILTPSVNNNILVNGDFGINLWDYWTMPCPGDNSIYYSIVRTSVMKNIFEKFPINALFHGMDWAFSSLLIKNNNIERCDGFYIIREKTNPMNYTNGVKAKYNIKSLFGDEMILLNPFGYLYKFIYLNCYDGDADLFKSVSSKMYQWLRVKIKEMYVSGVVIDPLDFNRLTLEHFESCIINEPISKFKIYEA